MPPRHDTPAPFIIDDRVVLYRSLALEIIDDPARVGDVSIDLVLTDPPYIISKKSGFARNSAEGEARGNARFHSYSTDHGAWDHGEFTLDDLKQVVARFLRILKPGGVAIVFFDLWKISLLAKMFEDLGFENIRMIEWLKTNPVPINSRRNYLNNAREVAIVGSKHGARPTFNSNSTGIFEYPIYHGKDRFHPTQKPVKLFEELIGIHTDPGATVLDCFSGSATTGVAALNTGRRHVGCEPDPEFFEKSSARLQAAAVAKTGSADIAAT